MSATIVVPSRFRGPRNSGNGGISAGLVAAHVDGEAVEVTLRAPPPLDVPLVIEADGTGVRVTHEGSLVATAQPASLALDAPPPVSFAEAEAAMAGYRNRHHHPLPECFVCGTARPDGLKLHAGPIGDGRFAAAWVPDASLDAGDGSVRPEVGWGALDCPSYLGLGLEAPFALLGRLTARVVRRPRIGERCVVIGHERAPRDGRKLYGGSALWGEDGALLGVGHAVWIEVDRASVPG